MKANKLSVANAGVAFYYIALTNFGPLMPGIRELHDKARRERR